MRKSLIIATAFVAVVITYHYAYPNIIKWENRSVTIPPQFKINSTYPSVHGIDVAAILDQEGEFSCLAVENDTNIPTAHEFTVFIKMKTNTMAYLAIPGLESEHAYTVYCYAKNDYDKVSTSSIESTARKVSTLAVEFAPVVVIGKVITTHIDADITVLVTLPGFVWCVVRSGNIIPSRFEVKSLASPVEAKSYTYTSYYVNNLTPSSNYTVFCTSESTEGTPMLSEMDKVGQSFLSADAPKPWYITLLIILITIVLVALSAMFSGLNLGLMGLDLISLRMVADTDVQEIAGDQAEPSEVKEILRDKEYARRILPIRKKGNLLLCTLLIGNVMVNSLISILTSDMTSGFIGFLISTCLITAFGEVIPQAYCSRYPLWIGSVSVGLVRVIIGLLWIICKPISMALDWALGDELGNVYNRYQLYTMFELYKEHSNFKSDTIGTMQGALVMDTKSVIEYLHAMDHVFMLSDTAVLDHTTCLDIFRKGYSRIPVYHEDRQNVVGILHTKELILIDPNQCIKVETVLQLFPSNILVINNKRTVADSIKDMVNSHTELAFVSETVVNDNTDNSTRLIGIVTLEDLIKAVMRLTLVDETPIMETKEVSGTLSCMFGNIVLNHLDPTTLDILCYFINQSLANRNLYLPQDILCELIRHGSIEKIRVGDTPIYKYGEICDFATIIMQGVFTVSVGTDLLLTEKPMFSVINLSAIIDDSFVSCLSLELFEKPVVDVLTNAVTGFNNEGFILKISKQSADSLKMMSRAVTLHNNESNEIVNISKSEHSIILPLEIDNASDNKNSFSL